MTEKQMTLDGALVPTRPHVDDVVECSDGTDIRYGDALFDVSGNTHRTEEARNEADADYVRGELDALSKWIDEWVEESDYGDSYAYIAEEVSHDWLDDIREWVDAELFDYEGDDLPDEFIDWVAEHIRDNLEAWECVHSRNEYAAYSGPGICLYSLDVGEVEWQIDLAGHDQFTNLHDEGRLEGLLESYNGDLYVYRNDHYDSDLGKRVSDGYVSKGDYPCIMVYANPGGQWHYVATEETLGELLDAAIAEYADYDE